MTLHDYGYLPPEFLKSYPVSELNFQIYILPQSLAFFQGCFRGGLYCYANFSIVLKPIFRGGIPGSKLLEEKASSKSKNVSKHRNELILKETLTNSCTVCHIITVNMLKTSKLGLISWTNDK